jgi:hypothetical protein
MRAFKGFLKSSRRTDPENLMVHYVYDGGMRLWIDELLPEKDFKLGIEKNQVADPTSCILIPYSLVLSILLRATVITSIIAVTLIVRLAERCGEK